MSHQKQMTRPFTRGKHKQKNSAHPLETNTYVNGDLQHNKF